MRIGLIGNGYWARVTHAAGLQAQPAVTLTGVWGRDQAKSDALAAEFGITAYRAPDELFADVDAVAFSVPPQVQVELALAAVRQGKHLLLEKPVALSTDDADRLADAVAEAGLASVVFFTSRFDERRRGWLDEVFAEPGWDGASGLFLGAAFAPDSPFDTPWRHRFGGLWDLGPHALSIVTAALGPVEWLSATAGPRDQVHLLLRHRGGAVSNYVLGIDNPATVEANRLTIWGAAGLRELPPGPADPTAALAAAAGELVAAAGQPVPSHPCDVQYGRQLVRLLAEAERQLSAG
ncbi:MAG TPA: Gfo/Idh/MocA family oxidoreductase [Jatrophihabitans sp.]|nr:Gfo/Idh/MocA family oxidoreductase [Jatrophihabitans sp.]